VKEAPMRQDVVFTANDIKTLLAADGKVSFYGIYFDTDKAILKPESAPAIKEIAEFLKANPAASIFIVGHTDNTGDFNKNLTLSKERATAVLNELVSKYAVNKQQLSAEGVASLAPVAPNDTNEGKAKNRRVEIVMR
jgi:outer membrane protein OmpA-like peptidoglycan-associated protein